MLMRITAVCVLVMASLHETVGNPAYVSRIPNGANVPGVAALGHVNPNGGGARNVFGWAFSVNKTWASVCSSNGVMIDTDADGFTNSEELGADCAGNILRTTGLSHPGDPNSVPPAGAVPRPATPPPTSAPTASPTTSAPTAGPTPAPTAPTAGPTTSAPTAPTQASLSQAPSTATPSPVAIPPRPSGASCSFGNVLAVVVGACAALSV